MAGSWRGGSNIEMQNAVLRTGAVKAAKNLARPTTAATMWITSSATHLQHCATPCLADIVDYILRRTLPSTTFALNHLGCIFSNLALPSYPYEIRHMYPNTHCTMYIVHDQ